jgi:hypothetical protein
MVDIPQEYVGSITENGEAFCFGVGIHANSLIYLDIAGPVETVKTIRTKIVSLGRLCYLNPPRGKSILLSAGSSQQFEVHQKKIAYGLVHAIFTHKSISQPVYAEKSMTYLIHANESQVQTRLGHHIHELLTIPVRTEWHSYLYREGCLEGLIKRCQTQGGIKMFAVNLEHTQWTMLIQRGLQNGSIHLRD